MPRPSGLALDRFDELWDFGDPAGTEEKFRELLPDVEASEDRSLELQLRTQIARALGLQKRYEEAHEVLDTVERDESVPPVVRVRTLLERGRVLNTSGSPEEARPPFEEAWRIARDAGEDAFAVDAAHMIAIVADADEAILWNERALELARTSPDERARKWRGSLLNNLGWTRHDLGEHEKALALFEEAVAARREQGDVSLVRIARWCVARAKRSLGRTDEALAEQRALLAEMEAEGTGDGYTLEEIAECLHGLGRVDEAQPYFTRAWEQLSQDSWLSENELERIARLRELGQVP